MRTNAYSDGNANGNTDVNANSYTYRYGNGDTDGDALFIDNGKPQHVTCQQRQRRGFPTVDANVVRSSSDLVRHPVRRGCGNNGQC